MPLFKNLKDFYYQYEMPLAQVFNHVDQRGLLVDEAKLKIFKKELDSALEVTCERIGLATKLSCVASQPKGVKTPKGTLNLSSPTQIRNILEELGVKLKKDRGATKTSTGEEALNEAYAQTGNPVLKDILAVRELNKIKGTYAEATLVDSILYTVYNTAGTVTGRRSSRATPFATKAGRQIGTNTQNFPKHSKLGERFRECIVARPDRIFLSCDQKQAEDWVVSGLIADWGGGTQGLDELYKGVDRHQRLASQIFNKPLSECHKKSIERYLGKKTRHAGNYGMKENRFAEVLTKEAPDFSEVMARTGKLVNYCKTMLGRFHDFEPEIRNTFQHGVETRLRDKRLLRTPIGRSRYFFGLRPGADNSKLFKEAFSYIPQSTVGDNTGLALLYCERVLPGWVVMDNHDAITLELPDTEKSIRAGIALLSAAFNRELTFENGLKMKIPIEFELGYDLQNTKELSPNVENIEELVVELRSLRFGSVRGAA